MQKIFRSFYLNRIFFIALAVVIFLFCSAFFIEELLIIARLAFYLLVLFIIIDIVLLYHRRDSITASRIMADKLSNGDENVIQVSVQNNFTFPVNITVIDELPAQLQERNFRLKCSLDAEAGKKMLYSVRPVKRGEYNFGALQVFVLSPLRLVMRRFRFEQDHTVPVYPAYIQMHKYELLAIHNRLSEQGIKKIRRIGHNQEFEQIREYVEGDDFRTINWRATARRNNFMVNQYQDERSQQVYSIIDKGRMMKMPFAGMTLLDYAINASLALSNIIIKKNDKAGIISFSDTSPVILKAEKKPSQMKAIMDILYRQKTRFLESNYEALYGLVRSKISQRSLLIHFTNFETLDSMKRNLGFFRAMAQNHLLVVVFFENTEISGFLAGNAVTTEDIYIKTIAEQFVYEKKQIVAELRKFGIHAILTRPENLTVNTINKYLELKARGLL